MELSKRRLLTKAFTHIEHQARQDFIKVKKARVLFSIRDGFGAYSNTVVL